MFKVPGLDVLNEKLKMFMVQYNETVRGGCMDLVFFKDAMVHLIKVLSNLIKKINQYLFLIDILIFA